MPAQVSQTDLVFRHADVELFRITLPPGQYTLGRNPDVQIYINTPLLSRRHARITIDPQHILIEDLKSSNGTFIDNQPVTKVTRVLPNQAIRFGDVHLEIRRRGQSEGHANPPKPHSATPPANAPKPHSASPPKSPSAPPPAAPRTPVPSRGGKSMAPFFAGIAVAVIACGAAAFFLWPREQKLTQAEFYAKTHPNSPAQEASATPRQNTGPPRPAEMEAQIGELRNALLAAHVEGLKDDAIIVSPRGKLSVNLRGSTISDLAVLSRFPVDELQVGGTKVTSLDPLRVLPLVTLHFDITGVTDVRPLMEIATLENVILGKSLTNLELLRSSSNIKRLSYESVHQGAELLPSQTAADFWKTYDEQKPKRAPAIAALQKMGIKEVTELKLTINKAGKFEIYLPSQPVSDLTPLSGLAIARLDLGSTKVSNLAPLHGMNLQYLNIRGCPVTDLTPLQGQAITDLIIGVKDWKKPNEGKTKVSDLAPLRGMPLHKISLDGALNPDVTPLAGCSSLQIVTLPANARNVEVLRKLPNLKKISWGYPGVDDKMTTATAFWKEYDAKQGASPHVAATAPDKAAAPAGDPAADAQAFGEAKQKRLDLLAKFQFTEAHDAILAPALQTEKARDEQEALAKKAEWLATFKSQLIEDLNKAGYAQPVASKSGVALPGTITQASEEQLTLRTARGPVPVPWTEISPDSLFAMGSSFIEPNMPKEIAAFRKWQLGVFASFAGKKEESLALLQEAAQLKSVYKDELPIFQNPTGPW